MTNKKAGLTLDDLDRVQAGAHAHEFEYIDEKGAPTGIWFSVFGGESEAVQKETARLQNERRRKEKAREINARIGVGKTSIDIETYESDVEYGKRVAAVRLAGWREAGNDEGLTAEEKERFCGIAAPFNSENALRLCKSNQHIALQIAQQSEEAANFLMSK